MLYLAEVKKHKQGFLKNIKTELILFAVKRNVYDWFPISKKEIISTEEANNFGDGVLAIVHLDNQRKFQKVHAIKENEIIKILNEISTTSKNLKEEEENIERWKESLTYQSQELINREIEIEERLRQVEQKEEELKFLEQQISKNNNTRRKITKIISARPIIGRVLQEADIVSTAQIEAALKNQSNYPELRLGEILALRGWVELETVDFFSKQWPTLVKQEVKEPLGYYLKRAGLLSEQQIDSILDDQKKLGLRLGALAVLKGWLKQTTLDFFLKNLFPDRQAETPWNSIKIFSSLPIDSSEN